MKYRDNQISMMMLLFSGLIHAVLFVQLTRNGISSQAQAPEYNTRISLNFLPETKQSEQQVKQQKPTPVQEVKKKLKPLTSKPKKILPKVVQQQAVAPRQASEVRRQLAEDTAIVKQRYLSRLLTHIEGYKFYPQSARRRGMQGTIKITFRLLQDGSIEGLTASGGPLLLKRAAKQAVKKAMPLPMPPVEVSYPVQVSYMMQYQLN